MKFPRKCTNALISRAIPKFLGMIALSAISTGAIAITCNPDTLISSTPAGPFEVPSSVITVTVQIGAATSDGATLMTIPDVGFSLDCDVDAPGTGAQQFPCAVDDGPVMTYVGDASISDTCTGAGGAALTFTSNNPAGGFATNDLVFTPSIPVVTAAPGTCTLSFDVQVLTFSNDSTTNIVEVGAGFNGSCNNGLTASARPTAGFQLVDCEVAIDKFVCVDHDDDELTPDICWGVDEEGGSGYALDGKDYTFYAKYSNTGDSVLGDCSVTDDIYGLIKGDPEDPEDLPFEIPVDGFATVELGGGTCSADSENEATISCGLCAGASYETSASDTADITCLTCAASIDKQVAGEEPWSYVDVTGVDDTDGTEVEQAVGWLDDDEVGVRYVWANTGDVDLSSCVITDSNGIIDVDAPLPFDLDFGGSGSMELRDPGDGFTCSAAFELQEPNTASISCLCDATIGGTPIDVLLPDWGPDCKASGSDTADIACPSATVDISKVCEEQDAEGNSLVTVMVTNTGEWDLENCVVSDEYTPRVDGIPQAPVAIDLDCGEINPNEISALPALGAPVECTGSIAGLLEEADNDVSVVCDIVDSRKQASDEAADVCEVPGDGCFTRTPGYWGTHPESTFWALGEPAGEGDGLVVCGVEIFQVDTGQGSAIEDMCSIGKDAKPNDTTNTQLQLERQCMAAALNLAASRELEGNCESELPGISDDFADCCGIGLEAGEASVCNGGVSSEEHTINACIDKLDTFNNYAFGEIDDDDLCPSEATGLEAPCSADSSVCRDAKGNGFVNAERDREFSECKGKNCN